MYRIWLQLVAFLGGFVVPGLLQVSGMEIFTSSEVEAVNGTNVRLKCTFSSRSPVQAQSVIVSWNFRPLNQGPEESVFYYHETSYPPTSGRFKDHAVWSGDIMRNDASITLHEVPPTFNGTYICQVHNKPDVHGRNGEIILKVVNKEIDSSDEESEPSSGDEEEEEGEEDDDDDDDDDDDNGGGGDDDD
ncbi:myelin protein zero-like protein 2b isoform X2 [Lampris incognitus]|uniref:myelin protein zero-like protein 2b isoform X2 n=1 Tax=Lampris incognitus TaxID=2546036 RepID=UPI0024B575E3|nr:myelin protein zero-like protein 2b isoform X2 [Lampris incognitus]